ncbi:MAG TPA: sugar phosphate nucleotidyltransferase [Acidimicrobiales bacterium]|jgi:bifunctional UDP-N-acetylglucosamine pyrophosphorylase/glucosamine-1-phosphate N-acetyltransferase|nr:sugar phosphate nucleotidyltransferase [Acidimicrobiales bacterium]
MSERPLSAIVLAAGQGTRMRSARPKPLHMLCGRPLVRYVIDAVAGGDATRAVVVVGFGADLVVKTLQEDPGPVPLEFVEQRVQNGTGEAVAVGLTGLPEDDVDDPDADDGDVLVLPGDTPLIRPETLAALVVEHRLSGAACTLLTARMADPTGYGRVVRDKDGRVRRIVEQRDAVDAELAIDEINTSIYVFRRGLLAPALRRLTPDNAQGELYVTDVVGVLAEAGHLVVSLVAEDSDETQGVNDRAQLAVAEAELRRRTNERWMREGVGMVDPAATYIDTTVTLAPDVVLFPGTVLQGATVVGAGTEIGPATRLADTRVGERAKVNETVATRAEIGDGAVVGPFAVLEPGSQVGAGVRTGPFYTGATG